MAEPQRVAQCVSLMRQAVDIPVTVKTRIGIDELDSFEFLRGFVQAVTDAGCDTVIIHARKAILNGLSPKENRTIPPLNYDRAYDIKRAFPSVSIIVNGGVNAISEIQQHWQHLDGVMIGREAYHNPFFLAEIEHQLFKQPLADRKKLLEAYLPYIEKQLELGVPLQNLTRHIFCLLYTSDAADE